MSFSKDRSTNTVLLEQDEAKLVGAYLGELASGDLNGSVAANICASGVRCLKTAM